jgi:hypothetical protein
MLAAQTAVSQRRFLSFIKVKRLGILNNRPIQPRRIKLKLVIPYILLLGIQVTIIETWLE